MIPLEFFSQHPVFTHEEFKQYAISQGTTNPNTQKEILAYHLKKQNIIRIRREFFASIPFSSRSDAESYLIDPYLIAGRISTNAVLAYQTAFALHGISYSMFNQITYMSQQKIRLFTFQQDEFICLSFPNALIKKNKMDAEVITVDRQGLNLKVTSIERTIVDALDRPEYSGGWEEIWRSAGYITILNSEKIVEYAMLLDNSSTIAKLGFFLEQHKEQFNTDEKYLKILETNKPRGIHYFNRTTRESGKFIKRWNLVVPKKITEKNWEEPTDDIF